MAPTIKERRESIPVIYVRGTHYDVGYDIGRTFRGLILSRIERHLNENSEIVQLVNSDVGQKIFHQSHDLVKKAMPGYLAELQGIADGAGVPFKQLFLFHIELMLFATSGVVPKRWKDESNEKFTRCTSIFVKNNKERLLGHNEDSHHWTLDHMIIVNCHIIPDKDSGDHWSFRNEERFTAACYAGELPGYCSGIAGLQEKGKGFVCSINTMISNKMDNTKLPAQFVTRRLLACSSIADVESVLSNPEFSLGEGFNINLMELKAPFTAVNFEAAPASKGGLSSRFKIRSHHVGYAAHCNCYLEFPEEDEKRAPIVQSSYARHDTIKSIAASKKQIETKQDVIDILGDTSHQQYRLFRDDAKMDVNSTVLTSIFDLVKSTWTIYTGNPKSSQPVAKLPF